MRVGLFDSGVGGLTVLKAFLKYHPNNEYFYYGGFAESFDKVNKREWLTSLYQKILMGDIVERNKVRNPRVLRLLARKLADSVMQPTTLKRLERIIKSSGDSISQTVLKDYLDYTVENGTLEQDLLNHGWRKSC